MRLRPWIATAAAFALALQMLLGGILATQAEAASLAPDSLFTICAGNGSAPSDHDTGRTGKHPTCVLCMLAKAAPAILSAETAITRLDVSLLAVLGPEPAAQISEFHSPTGRYQRGPPFAPIAG